MYLNALLNQVTAFSVNLKSAVNDNSVTASNGKEFHIISSETFSNVVSVHRRNCSNFGLERISILYLDSDIFIHVQWLN